MGDVHEHSEDIADERNPVYKLDMDIPAIRLLGVNRHIKKHPPSKRKLRISVQTAKGGWAAWGEYQGARGIDADTTGLGSEMGERGERDAKEPG
jgi:hypothetical protein